MKEAQTIGKAAKQKEKVKAITKRVNQIMKMKEKNMSNNSTDNIRKNLKKPSKKNVIIINNGETKKSKTQPQQQNAKPSNMGFFI